MDPSTAFTMEFLIGLIEVHCLRTKKQKALANNNQPGQYYFLKDILKQPALWFSKNGDRLVYITFNDTSVPEIKLPIYSEPDSFHLYTEEVIIRYPTVSQRHKNY